MLHPFVFGLLLSVFPVFFLLHSIQFGGSGAAEGVPIAGHFGDERPGAGEAVQAGGSNLCAVQHGGGVGTVGAFCRIAAVSADVPPESEPFVPAESAGTRRRNDGRAASGSDGADEILQTSESIDVRR